MVNLKNNVKTLTEPLLPILSNAALTSLCWTIFLSTLFSYLLIDEAVNFLQILLSSLVISRIIFARSKLSRQLTWADVLDQVLIRWLLLTAAAVAVFAIKQDLIAPLTLLQLLCFLGHVLFYAILQLVQLFKKRNIGLYYLHLPCVASFVILGEGTIDPTTDYLLLISLGSLIVLVCLSLGSAQKLYKDLQMNAQQICYESGSGLLARYSDIVALPLILPPSSALPYLVARGLVECSSGCLNILSTMVQANMGYARTIAEKRATAARINLGFLLVGGGLTVATLGVSPLIPMFLGETLTSVPQVLPWLALSAAVPALFGATRLLIPFFVRGNIVSYINWIAIFLFAAGFLFVPVKSATDLAILTAATSLTCGVLGSGVLGLRAGIWPGVTVVLFKQVKVRT